MPRGPGALASFREIPVKIRPSRARKSVRSLKARAREKRSHDPALQFEYRRCQMVAERHQRLAVDDGFWDW